MAIGRIARDKLAMAAVTTVPSDAAEKRHSAVDDVLAELRKVTYLLSLLYRSVVRACARISVPTLYNNDMVVYCLTYAQDLVPVLWYQ